MQGLFIWGDVGRGKSLLMDLFSVSFEGGGIDEWVGVPAAGRPGGPAVARRHYHDFMREVHERLHVQRRRGSARDAVRLTASEVARGCPAVLCLDEFQVTNISDAVVLRAFFEALFAKDVFVVMTSNRPPEDLYKDGLNHMIYMPPFLRLLQDRVRTHHIDAPLDYRERKVQTEAVAMAEGHSPAVPDYIVASVSSLDLHEAYERVAGCSPGEAGRAKLAVAWGRRLQCAAMRDGVALFSFGELCGRPLGADDYMALVQRNSVHTVALEGVPCFTVEQHNEARRFMNLIDCLYENQCRLLCSAAAGPEELMAEVEALSHVPVATQPAMGLAGSERSLRRHGDVTFEVSDRSPCRPDTFATAEADAEAGTVGGLLAAVHAARARSAGGKAGATADASEQDGVAGVMSAALVSLQESGFAARRCASRLREMSTAEYRRGHRERWAL